MLNWNKHISLLFIVFVCFSCTKKKEQPNRLTITASYEGASPEAMEQLITHSIEKAFRDLQTSSITSSGKCVVTISSEMSLDSLRYLVRARMPDKTLPQNIDPPIIADYVDPDVSVIRYVLKSDLLPMTQLHKWNEEVLAAELERMPKVRAAYTVGTGRQEILISPDVQKLNAYGVGVDELVNAIGQEISGLSSGTQGLLLKNTIGSPEDFQNIVIRNEKNKVILLRDLAEIAVTTRDEGPAVYLDAGNPDSYREVIEGVVVFNNELPPAEMEKQFYSVLDQVKKKMPAGMEILPFFGTTTKTQQLLQLKVQYPPGQAKESVREANAKIRQLIMDHAGVISLVSETGFSLNEDIMEKDCHTFYINTDKSKTNEDLENSLQTILDALPGISSWFVHHSSEEYPAGYSLKISAPGKEKLPEAIAACKEKLSAAEGISNIHINGIGTASILDFTIERNKAGHYGISPSALQGVIDLYQNGRTWARMNELPVTLKFKKNGDPAETIHWKIKTPDGLIPVTDLVSVTMKAEPSVILREDHMPLARICFSVKNEGALKALEKLLMSMTPGQDVTLRLEKDR